MSETPAPSDVAMLVNDYIRSERLTAEKYDNRTPLDESGVWGLHELARQIYARGWIEGAQYKAEQARGAKP